MHIPLIDEAWHEKLDCVQIVHRVFEIWILIKLSSITEDMAD